MCDDGGAAYDSSNDGYVDVGCGGADGGVDVDENFGGIDDDGGAIADGLY